MQRFDHLKGDKTRSKRNNYLINKECHNNFCCFFVVLLHYYHS